MAQVREAKANNSTGSYARVLGVLELGALVSKIHATSIRNGNQLERMVAERVQHVPDLDEFLTGEIMPEGVLLATKQAIKASAKISSGGAEPDFMVFRRRDGQQRCHVIELKIGHVFDTKKAAAEHNSIHRFLAQAAPDIPYVMTSHFCAFFQDDRDAILNGFKQKIAPAEAMTGREFCDLLEIDYEEIVRKFDEDAADNLRYVLRQFVDYAPPEVLAEQALASPALVDLLQERLSSRAARRAGGGEA